MRNRHAIIKKFDQHLFFENDKTQISKKIEFIVLSTLLEMTGEKQTFMSCDLNEILATGLIWAVKNNPEVVEPILQAKADPNIIDEDSGYTSLLLAIQHYRLKRIEVVEALLNAKADPDKSNGEISPLHYCVEFHSDEIAKLLIKAKADPNKLDAEDKTPLICAAEHRCINLVIPLLESKANINHRDREGKSVLDKAIMKNNLPMINLLLESKANNNDKFLNGMPLLCATRHGHLEEVKNLLTAGADPNKENELTGETPLTLAIQHRQLDIAKILLQTKANPYKKGPDGTPLWLAARSGYSAIIKMLLDAKVDPNIADEKTGATMLIRAVSENTDSAVRELLKVKVNVNLLDHEKNSALDKAVTEKNLTLVRLLLESNAKINNHIKLLDFLSSLKNQNNPDILKCLEIANPKIKKGYLERTKNRLRLLFSAKNIEQEYKNECKFPDDRRGMSTSWKGKR